MSEIRFPVCPICKKEVLLPFSISQNHETSKEYGSWICTNCGFYITTSETRAIDPINDIETGFNYSLCEEIKKMREEYKE